jgi:hypothetical protein
MIHLPVGEHDHWEDAYAAMVYENFDGLMVQARELWSGPYEPYNWPVWTEYDAENEEEYDCGPTVAVGVFLARHGDCAIHVAPATPEQYQEIKRVLLEVWARRADAGFPRWGGERHV